VSRFTPFVVMSLLLSLNSVEVALETLHEFDDGALRSAADLVILVSAAGDKHTNQALLEHPMQAPLPGHQGLCERLRPVRDQKFHVAVSARHSRPPSSAAAAEMP